MLPAANHHNQQRNSSKAANSTHRTSFQSRREMYVKESSLAEKEREKTHGKYAYKKEKSIVIVDVHLKKRKIKSEEKGYRAGTDGI